MKNVCLGLYRARSREVKEALADLASIEGFDLGLDPISCCTSSCFPCRLLEGFQAVAVLNHRRSHKLGLKHLSTYLSIYLSTYLSIYLSTYLSI